MQDFIYILIVSLLNCLLGVFFFSLPLRVNVKMEHLWQTGLEWQGLKCLRFTWKNPSEVLPPWQLDKVPHYKAAFMAFQIESPDVEALKENQG